jgi:predicted XRE-type DNA-binding protein
MNKKLSAELRKLDDAGFITLEHHVNFARAVRDLISKNAFTDEQISAKLGIKAEQVNDVITGAYEFDLRFLASIQALQMSIATENARIKIEAQVQFPEYKHSENPAIISKLDTILEHLGAYKPQ